MSDNTNNNNNADVSYSSSNNNNNYKLDVDEAATATSGEEALLAWADDKYCFGHQLACLNSFYGPDLEENLALGSMAQDHLGHARLLYTRLAKNDEAVDRLVFTRPPSDYRTSLLAAAWQDKDWAFLVIKGLLYAQAELIRCAVVAEGGESSGMGTSAGSGAKKGEADLQKRNIAGIIERDEAVHFEHWQQWVAVLARSEEGLSRLQTALDQLWPLGEEFFSLPGWDVEQRRQRLADWREQAGGCLLPLGFKLPSAVLPVEKLPANGYGPEVKEEGESQSQSQGGLSGRQGRHTAAFCQMLQEAHSLYQTYQPVVLA